MKNIRLILPFITAITAVCILALGLPAEAQLFKCKDENGVTHYGQTMPAACDKKEITEINKQGREIGKLNAPLTPEQLQARSQAAAKKAAEDQRIAEQRLKDMAMLNTYGVEREIDIQRDKELNTIEQRRKLAQSRIPEATARLEKITNEMEFYIAGKSKTTKPKDEKAGKSDGKDTKTNAREVPAQLQADYDRAKAGRLSIDVELARLEADRKTVVARFEVEKERYRRLKGGMRPGTILDDKGNVVLDAPLARNVQAPAPTRR